MIFKIRYIWRSHIAIAIWALHISVLYSRCQTIFLTTTESAVACTLCILNVLNLDVVHPGRVESCTLWIWTSFSALASPLLTSPANHSQLISTSSHLWAPSLSIDINSPINDAAESWRLSPCEYSLSWLSLVLTQVSLWYATKCYKS